ncbi:MAG: hypothetical protein DPW09_17840 [Anaerolineae bacterium]|nr:hypothetical protein [Anaerolineae bacterium]
MAALPGYIFAFQKLSVTHRAVTLIPAAPRRKTESEVIFMPPSPDLTFLQTYGPPIIIAFVMIFLFVLGVVWIYFESNQNKQTPHYADPDATWRLYQMHALPPHEEELSEDEWQRWEEENAEFDRREQARLAEVNAEIARRREMAARLAQEQAQIAQDFPKWLVDFAESYGIQSYAGLVKLSQWITTILTYCENNFAGRMPIKRCYQAASEGYFGQAPNHQCYGRLFFEHLSKTLARNGLLIDGAGPQGRKITDDALIKLRSKP